MKKIIFVILIGMASYSPTVAQDYASWNGTELILDNGLVKRVVSTSESGGFTTTLLTINQNEKNFVLPDTEEFSFLLNGQYYDGTKDWEVVDFHPQNNGEAIISLKGTSKNLKNVEIDITYALYPRLSVIRKKLSFRNTGTKDIKVEGVNVERIKISSGLTQTWTYHNFARQKWYGQLFRGNFNDPLVIAHNIEEQSGIVLGNEAPGVLKETTVLQKIGLITVGLTQPDETFSFQKWLTPGEEWESPWVFMIPYTGTKDPQELINNTVNDFVRKYMGIRLSEIPIKPFFVYNTWNPFRTNINDSLIIQLANAAAECGIGEFVIDDGWQNNRGDWEIDKVKFPNGLKPVFDHIKSKGMKPGLWISIASVSPDSEVFKEHPDWLLRDESGEPVYIHNDSGKTIRGEINYSMSMGTGWIEHIKAKILNLVNEHGLEYLKADLAVVSGAYTFDKTRSGDYSKNNLLYRSREESLLILYRRLWQLFDDLHKEAPDLFIDCTFETVGALHLIGYDMCKHAEGNWLSNIEDAFPTGAFRVRQLAWSRTPVIPATALVIGNLQLNSPDWEENLKSLVGTLPIVLGDLREIDPEIRIKIQQWANWLKKMQKDHNYMMFRQDLPGFGEPAEGFWDGWERINTKTKKGGIVGVFRQGGFEIIRRVRVSGLDPQKVYSIKQAPSEKLISKMSGKQLLEEGFEVQIKNMYGGEILSIEVEKN